MNKSVSIYYSVGEKCFAAAFVHIINLQITGETHRKLFAANKCIGTDYDSSNGVIDSKGK